MHLYDLPLVFAVIGLALYTVLGGADFGAGIWQLTAGTGPEAERIREHAHRSMAPVWEANHVWLIFVLTVFWTAYPTAFGSIASTLSVPLFLAAIGIILRGVAYALRSGAGSARELSRIDALFAIASLLTPFALGAAVGGIAARRVPVGNAAGHLFASWTGPVSIMIGTFAVAISAYLAGVYLSADAARLGDRQLERAFRARALLAGVAAGALAVAGLVVLHSDAHRLYHGLVNGSGLPALIVSLVAGALTLGLVVVRRYEAARYSAALAVASILAGWALAQKPTILPGLTIQHAAAPHDTLVLVVVAVLGGGAILFPSLVLLFRLLLRGQFDPGADHKAVLASSAGGLARASASGLVARSAGACLISGFGLLTIADAAWAHTIGVVCLLAFVVLGFAAIRPTAIAASGENEPSNERMCPPQASLPRLGPGLSGKSMERAVQLIVLGPPGAGKGTQTAQLAERFGLARIGPGEMLRQKTQVDSPSGQRIRAVMAAGELAPDELIDELVRERLEALSPEQGFVLDGYPRTAAEAETLHQTLAQLGRLDRRPLVVWLDVTHEELLRRLRRRRQVEGRADDTEEAVARRMATHEARAGSVRNALESWADVIVIDGDQEPDEVTRAHVQSVERRAARPQPAHLG